jgi:hypothetical protein
MTGSEVAYHERCYAEHSAKGRQPAGSPAPGSPTGLEARVASLEQRVADLEARAGRSPGGSALPTPLPAPPAESPISVSMVSKRYHRADYLAGDGDDRIDFELLFRSRLPKDVRAFTGSVVFKDLFDEHIPSVNLTYEDGIRAGGTARWRGGIAFNQFLPAHQRLLAIEPRDTQVSFKLDAVIYADGS